MQRLSREHLSTMFDHRLPPLLTVQSGETFVVEMEDARSGRTRTPETTTTEFILEMKRKGWYGNPVTGPIFVEGAEPGDTLKVEIIDLTCDNLGWIPIWPHLFHFEDFFAQPETRLVEVRDDHVLVAGRQVPLKPMIGTIGVAPAMEAPLSGDQGRFGGNLDTEEITAGSTLYLPVFVPGALLSLGDCHAVQSDAELASVEIRATATVKCEVIKGRSPVMSWPRIETPELLVTVAVGRPLEEALWGAFRDLILWVEERTGMSKQDAYQLIGTGGFARPGQAQVGHYTMRCGVPKALIDG